MPCKSSRIWVFVILAGLLSATTAGAQDAADDAWVIKSNAGLALTQSSFSSAWAGDEVGTISWALTWNSEAGKQLASWAHWQNTLALQFGQTHQQDDDRERWLAPRKSADKITYRGIVRFPYGGYFDPFVAFDVDSQFFLEDSTTKETRLFTPTTFTQSAGLAHAFYNTDQRRLISRLGFAAKERLNRFARILENGDIESETDLTAGFEWFTSGRLASKEDRIVYSSELRVFKAVATNEDVETRHYWPAVDIDWQNTLSNKIVKWISVDLFWQLLYDKQIDLRGQFKQTLGLGVTWQLI